jgi:hypothetical protein
MANQVEYIISVPVKGGLKQIGKTVHAERGLEGRPIKTSEVRTALLKYGDWPRNIVVRKGKPVSVSE